MRAKGVPEGPREPDVRRSLERAIVEACPKAPRGPDVTQSLEGARNLVVALAFVATAVSSLFAQAMLVRYTRTHRPEYRAWAISLTLFALASAALATGTSTGWDQGTFRVFFLLGAVVNVPWLALGTVFLLCTLKTARRAQWVVVCFTMFAAGVVLSAPMDPVARHRHPAGERRVRRVARACSRPSAAAWRRS